MNPDPTGPPAQPDPERTARLAAFIRERAGQLVQRHPGLADPAVTVVAVTKGHPPQVAAAAVAAGFSDLGENYAQELRDKADLLGVAPDGPRWHFIGRLQSNKVRMLAPRVALWQSVDRPSLVREIARRSPGAAVLVQVDLAGIPERGGCPREAAEALVVQAVAAGLDVRGLMGVGPPGEPEEARPGFRWLRSEADSLGLAEVSMGMSGDLHVALDEGATIVRIGSALVGARPTPAP